MRVSEQILRAVCFLYTSEKREELQVVVPRGTAFVVAVPFESGAVANGASMAHLYLVTARHIIDAAEGREVPLLARINLKDGGLRTVDVSKGWVSSDIADVAVLPLSGVGLGYHWQNFDAVLIAVDSFATDQKIDAMNIGIGDDIYLSGMFPMHTGSNRNAPVVRFGSIAAMPGEPVRTAGDGARYPGYLVEVRSIGGLSGAPVLVVVGYERPPSGEFKQSEATLVLGLIRGHWDLAYPGEPSTGEDRERVNSGIAIATPIQEAAALFGRDDVRAARLVNERKWAEDD